MNKLLLELFEKYPETKVTYINKIKNIYWQEWKEFQNCNEEELKLINLRQIFPNEIILDSERETDLNFIKNKLNNENYFYSIYNTGSRGHHINLYFKNLDKLTKVERTLIRKYLISQFNCDISKSTETGLIAMEDCAHFKTEKNKIMIEEREGINILSQELINKIEDEINKLSSNNSNAEDISFKDYHIKDPLFKYISQNIISDNQDRNMVVFKNIAIALIKEGLNKNEIRILMEPIIFKNFTGRNINEFMGWCDKALLGELKDYNIRELNKWSKTFGHEIFYEEIEGIDEIIKNFSLKQLWNEYWQENMIGQSLWRDLLFYSLIGTVLDEREEDLRIHIIFSSYTSTGKDSGVNLVINILNKLNIKSTKPVETTDRFLVGGVDDFARQHNLKIKLKMKTESVVEELLQEESYGALYNNLFIAFTEAEIVFAPSTFNKRIQLILRRVMDKDRNISKGMSNHEINYFTNSTLILTSYPQLDVINRLLTNGLFQRTFFLNAEINKEVDREIKEYLISKMFNISSREKSSIYLDELAARLIVLKEYWHKNKQKILNNFASNKFYHKVIAAEIKKIEESYNYLMEEDQQILDAILRRGIDNIKRLIILDTLANNEEELNIKSINKSIDIFKKCLMSVKSLIWGSRKSKMIETKNDKNEEAILKFLKTNINSPAMILRKFMQDELGLISFTTQNKYLELMSQKELITQTKEGKNIFYKIIEQ